MTSRHINQEKKFTGLTELSEAPNNSDSHHGNIDHGCLWDHYNILSTFLLHRKEL